MYSISSSSISDNEDLDKVGKEPAKSAKHIGKENINEIVPISKVNPLREKYGAPTNNALVIDGLLAELIQIKKVSGRFFSH